MYPKPLVNSGIIPTNLNWLAGFLEGSLPPGKSRDSRPHPGKNHKGKWRGAKNSTRPTLRSFMVSIPVLVPWLGIFVRNLVGEVLGGNWKVDV